MWFSHKNKSQRQQWSARPPSILSSNCPAPPFHLSPLVPRAFAPLFSLLLGQPTNVLPAHSFPASIARGLLSSWKYLPLTLFPPFPFFVSLRLDVTRICPSYFRAGGILLHGEEQVQYTQPSTFPSGGRAISTLLLHRLLYCPTNSVQQSGSSRLGRKHRARRRAMSSCRPWRWPYSSPPSASEHADGGAETLTPWQPPHSHSQSMNLYHQVVLHLSGSTVPSPPWKAALGAAFSC